MARDNKGKSEAVLRLFKVSARAGYEAVRARQERDRKVRRPSWDWLSEGEQFTHVRRAGLVLAGKRPKWVKDPEDVTNWRLFRTVVRATAVSLGYTEKRG